MGEWSDEYRLWKDFLNGKFTTTDIRLGSGTTYRKEDQKMNMCTDPCPVKCRYRIPTKPFTIRKVIFNGPATIVFWTDKTKTVVKATNEYFDPEKGLAMAIAKKALGNKGGYYNVFKKWCRDTEEEVEQLAIWHGDGVK